MINVEHDVLYLIAYLANLARLNIFVGQLIN